MTTLIDAYTAWDAWARQVSERAAAAIKAGQKPPTPTASSGAKVTAALIEAEDIAGADIGISGRRLHMRIINSRQSGLSITEAITQALKATA